MGYMVYCVAHRFWNGLGSGCYRFELLFLSSIGCMQHCIRWILLGVEIHATFSRHGPSLGALEDVQTIKSSKCDELSYTVYSSNQSEVIFLQVQRPEYNSGIYLRPKRRQIEVTLKGCPPGFTLNHNPAYCDCIKLLANNNITCNINTQTIHRPPPVWIGHSNSHETTAPSMAVMFHHHCPFDFCLPHDVDINVTNLTIKEDEQCDVGRTGVLCGACKEGLSLALGTSKCIHCTNYWLLLLVVFIFAGIALVFLLIVCNLTGHRLSHAQCEFQTILKKSSFGHKRNTHLALITFTVFHLLQPLQGIGVGRK